MITRLSGFSALAIVTTSLTVLFTPARATALSLNWYFVTDSSSTGGQNQIIKGTIDGLVEGSNNGSGLTVTVDFTPTGQLTGGGWTFAGSDLGGYAFTVTGGTVTFADARFERAGTSETLQFGGFGGFNSLLVDFSSFPFNPGWFSAIGNKSIFIPVDSTASIWSFVTQTGSTGGAGQVISGRIGGLVEGSNNGSGLTVTVDSTPTGQLTGGGWTFANTGNGGDAFTVTGGNVTFADASFIRNGGNQELAFGGFGGYTPRLADFTNFPYDPYWDSFSMSNAFTPVNTGIPSTPEPSSVLGLLGLSLGVLASALLNLW